MKMFFIVLDIALMIIDVIVFLRLIKICKDHLSGDETVVLPVKKVLPYAVTMAVISILIPLIGLLQKFV